MASGGYRVPRLGREYIPVGRSGHPWPPMSLHPIPARGFEYLRVFIPHGFELSVRGSELKMCREELRDEIESLGAISTSETV